MSSYRNHIKKFDDIRSKSVICTGENVVIKSSESEKVIKPKKVKNQLPDLTEIEKDNINNVNDFHEFIEGPKLHDDSEE